LVNAVVLMYHDVTPIGRRDSSGFGGADAARYKLTTREFADHLSAIRARAERPPVTVAGLAGAMPLLLSFDDGGEGAATAADALERLGWRGHFLVTTGWIARPGFLQKRTIRDLRARGHVIGSHSHTHPLRMSRCPEARLRDEWHTSTAILADILGDAVTCGSVPGGYCSPTVVTTAADAGIRFLFTSRPTVRAARVRDTWVLGRYVMQRFTTPAVAAGLAAGDLKPRLRQAAVWGAKGICKAIGGAHYLRVRGWLLGRASSPQWGDDMSRASEDSA
jgi:peptidoglycan/xylan/chitin deacetylase (PgdA/CDA1 family)